jgi:hypothetical protein
MVLADFNKFVFLFHGARNVSAGSRWQAFSVAPYQDGMRIAIFQSAVANCGWGVAQRDVPPLPPSLVFSHRRGNYLAAMAVLPR